MFGTKFIVGNEYRSAGVTAFLENVAHMEFDRAFCNIERPRYLGVGHAAYDEGEYLLLPRREAEPNDILLKALPLQFLGIYYRSIPPWICRYGQAYRRGRGGL